MNIGGMARKAREAALVLGTAKTSAKNRALENISLSILKNKNAIINENKKDVDEAQKNSLSSALLKRLVLDDSKIKDIIGMVGEIMKLDDPVGKVTEEMELDKGLNLRKVTVPIGVIGAIFESRPDALVQIACLCIKSGNAVILKPGSEAKNTSKAIVSIIRKSLEKEKLPADAVQLIETRQHVKEMLKMHDHIGLLIPRGSGSFVKYIQENTKIPVLGHAEGICHVYVDRDADLKKAIGICYDAKCQYPAVCNAMETMLVHKDIAKKFLPLMARKFREADVEIRGDNGTKKILKSVKNASEKDWKTEYNSLILSIKIVNDLDEAIEHINEYGSKHTDAIVTENSETADVFMAGVDSSSVMHNCSTRFADGFRYGKGAEVGISTSKIHGRGPLGMEGLVIYKYLLKGSGQTVRDYAEGKKHFTHRRIR